MKLYEKLARAVISYKFEQFKILRKKPIITLTQGEVYYNKYEGDIEFIMRTAPNGSGFDSGTKFVLQKSDGAKLVFTTEFHHLNDNGSYIRWTKHRIVVEPTFFQTISVHVYGENYRGIKDYISEVFRTWLEIEYEVK